MRPRMEWDIDSEIKVDIATFTITLVLTRNLGLRDVTAVYEVLAIGVIVLIAFCGV